MRLLLHRAAPAFVGGGALFSCRRTACQPLFSGALFRARPLFREAPLFGGGGRHLIRLRDVVKSFFLSTFAAATEPRGDACLTWFDPGDNPCRAKLGSSTSRIGSGRGSIPPRDVAECLPEEGCFPRAFQRGGGEHSSQIRVPVKRKFPDRFTRRLATKELRGNRCCAGTPSRVRTAESSASGSLGAPRAGGRVGRSGRVLRCSAHSVSVKSAFPS